MGQDLVTGTAPQPVGTAPGYYDGPQGLINQGVTDASGNLIPGARASGGAGSRFLDFFSDTAGKGLIGSAVGGIGAGAGALLAANKKAASAKELLEEQALLNKQAAEDRVALVQAGSAGGKGVNLNIRPTANTLLRPNGAPVFGSNGLIGSQVNR
jgi:hypothetical protein